MLVYDNMEQSKDPFTEGDFIIFQISDCCLWREFLHICQECLLLIDEEYCQVSQNST